jgi:hypothetical protein
MAARVMKAAAALTTTAAGGALAFSLCEHNPIETHILGTVLQTAMWMPGSPLRLLRADPLLPTSAADLLDKEALRACLLAGGAISPGTQLASVKVDETFGRDEQGNPKGVLSTMAKVEVEYDVSEADGAPAGAATGPRTMIAKLCPTDFGARMLGRLCFFETEVRAYEKDLLGLAGAQTPRCYYAKFDRVSGESVLFLEDLAPLSTRGQVEGYNADEMRRTLAEISKVHATYHGATTTHPALQGWNFIQFGEPMIQAIVHDLFEKSVAGVPEKVAVGLGRSVASYYRSSTSHQIIQHIRRLYFWSDNATEPQVAGAIGVQPFSPALLGFIARTLAPRNTAYLKQASRAGGEITLSQAALFH